MNDIAREQDCPVCGEEKTFPFLRRDAVPVHQNLVLDQPEAARAMTRGNLVMHVCLQCGFGFNAAFEPSLLNYGRHYDNSQNWSPAFDAYTDELVRHLVETEGVRNCKVVEVGCGKGAFLRKLISYPGANNTGFGFDPAYEGPLVDLEGRLQFERTILNESVEVAADVVICRHVIEHIPQPIAFLRSLHAGLSQSQDTRLFFETPCLEWILSNRVVWDFFYEHCSLFTLSSLAAALTRVGYAAISGQHVFGGQYLWMRASLNGRQPQETPTDSSPASAVAAQAQAFARLEASLRSQWSEIVQTRVRAGKVAVWGAGAKGVTFCNLVDPDRKQIDQVIDINPAKQGKFLPGTGHPILGPDDLNLRTLRSVIVLNPSYTVEISRRLERHPQCMVIDAMRIRDNNQCA